MRSSVVPECAHPDASKTGSERSAIRPCCCAHTASLALQRLSICRRMSECASSFRLRSAACSADPSFALEGASGLDVLWSSCEACGFARVVL